MTTEENNIYNEPINNEQKEEELKKALEKKIKLQKELEEKRMEEIKRRLMEEEKIKEEELKKALENKIKLQKELEKKRMEEMERRRLMEEEGNKRSIDAGPPRLKKNYGCEQKFVINFEIEKLEHRISLEFRTDEKISDIMAKLKQIYKINSRIILIFENKDLNPDSLIAETELYPYCTLKVIY